MKNWVCYSVAVYVGLLLAGSLMTSRQASARSSWNEPPCAMVVAPPPTEPAPAEIPAGRTDEHLPATPSEEP